jgi:hypothetical protein
MGYMPRSMVGLMTMRVMSQSVYSDGWWVDADSVCDNALCARGDRGTGQTDRSIVRSIDIGRLIRFDHHRRYTYTHRIGSCTGTRCSGRRRSTWSRWVTLRVSTMMDEHATRSEAGGGGTLMVMVMVMVMIMVIYSDNPTHPNHCCTHPSSITNRDSTTPRPPRPTHHTPVQTPNHSIDSIEPGQHRADVQPAVARDGFEGADPEFGHRFDAGREGGGP